MKSSISFSNENLISIDLFVLLLDIVNSPSEHMADPAARAAWVHANVDADFTVHIPRSWHG